MPEPREARCPECGKLLGTTGQPVQVRRGPSDLAADDFETKCPRCSVLVVLTFSH